MSEAESACRVYGKLVGLKIVESPQVTDYRNYSSLFKRLPGIEHSNGHLTSFLTWEALWLYIQGCLENGRVLE